MVNRKGERNPRAKLTEEAVRDIRTSNWTGVELALKYGVSEVTIHRVRRNKSWRHYEATA